MIDVYLTGNPSVTFAREAYKRYTEHLSYKKKFIVESNFFTFDYTVPNDIDIIKNIWIKNYDSINKINLLLVPKYNNLHPHNLEEDDIFQPRLHNRNLVAAEENIEEDLADPNDNTLLVNQDYNPDEHNNPNNANNNPDNYLIPQYTIIDENTTLKSLLEMPGTILINSICKETLLFMQSFNNNTNYNNKEYLEIPVSKSAYNLQTIDKSRYKLVIHFEKNKPEPIKLIIKMLKPLGAEEKRRINELPAEWLIKRYIDISYNVKSNDQIVPDFINTSLVTLVIKSPVKLNSVKIGTHEFVDSRDNPENPYTSENSYFYFLEVLNETCGFTSAIQPTSNYSFTPTDTINITHDYAEEIPINITYFIYDVQRYLSNTLSYVSYQNVVYPKYIKAIYNLIQDSLQTENLLSKEEFINLMNNIKLDKKLHYQMIYNNQRNNFDDEILNFNNGVIKLNRTSNYNHYKNEFYKKYPHKLIIEQPEDEKNNQIQEEQEEQEEQEAQEEQPVQPNPPAFVPILPPGINNAEFIEMRQEQELIKKRTKFMNLYFPFLVRIVEKMEKEEAIHQELSEDVLCEITLDPIKKSEYYYCCSSCNGKFESSTLKYCIENNEKNNCPKCKTAFVQMPQLYLNN